MSGLSNVLKQCAPMFVGLGLALLAACGQTGLPAGSVVEGDPWDYNLRQEDIPPKLEQDYFNLESGVITNRDVSLTAGDPSLFQTVNAQGRRFGHVVQFSGASADSFNRVAAMVVTYRNAEGAAAGQAERLPGPDPDVEWVQVPGAGPVGDESSVWQMLASGGMICPRAFPTRWS